MYDVLTTLSNVAAARKNAISPYAGDVTVQETWSYIQLFPACLVDVRTAAEWSFSGVPVLDGTHAIHHCISWIRYPDFEANPTFMTEITATLPHKNTPIFFLCKTGVRSYHAANSVAQEGYMYAFNVLHGFEGDHNIQRQRGCVNGWKAEGMPWMQA